MRFAAGFALLALTSFVPAFAGIPAVPEPSTFVLVGGGIGAAILVARWKNSHK